RYSGIAVHTISPVLRMNVARLATVITPARTMAASALRQIADLDRDCGALSPPNVLTLNCGPPASSGAPLAAHPIMPVQVARRRANSRRSSRLGRREKQRRTVNFNAELDGAYTTLPLSRGAIRFRSVVFDAITRRQGLQIQTRI